MWASSFHREAKESIVSDYDARGDEDDGADEPQHDD